MGRVLTAAKLLVRPRAYPRLWRLTRQYISGRELSLEDTADEATRWCQRHEKTAEDVIAEITGEAGPILNVRETFANVFEQADQSVKECPDRMGGAGDINLLYSIANSIAAKIVVETGVAYGWSSLALLLALQGVKGGRLFSTNLPYREMVSTKSVGCAVPEQLRNNWTVYHKADLEALPAALNAAGTIDLAHYDSDKSYSGRMFALPRLWTSLRVGGVLVCDDINDNLGFAHFCKCASTRPSVVQCNATNGVKFVGILQKTSDRRLRNYLF